MKEHLGYNDYELPFEKLFEKDGLFTVHHYNIQTLIINTYNTRVKSDFVIPQIKTVFKGSNSIRCYGPVIWNLITAEMKYVHSLETFKS